MLFRTHTDTETARRVDGEIAGPALQQGAVQGKRIGGAPRVEAAEGENLACAAVKPEAMRAHLAAHSTCRRVFNQVDYY